MSKPSENPVEIFVGIDDWSDHVDLRERVASALGLRATAIERISVVRRSLDARKGRPIGYRLLIDVDVTGAPPRPSPATSTSARPAVQGVLAGERVVIAGSGPAGTFAALRLAE